MSPSNISKKILVGNDQEKAQSEKDSHSKTRGGKNKINNQIRLAEVNSAQRYRRQVVIHRSATSIRLLLQRDWRYY